MAWIDERDVMIVLEDIERGMVNLASGGDLDERGILLLLNAAIRDTSHEPGSALHLRLLQMQRKAEDALEAYEARAPRDDSEDRDDE